MGLRNTFSTVETDIARNNTVYAESSNAFPDPVSGVINLIDNTEYIITQSISLDAFLNIPESGQITIRAINSTANTLTIKGITGSIGRLDIILVAIISIDGLEDFLDISAGEGLVPVVTIDTCRIQGFASLGTLTGGNLFSENVGWLLNKGPLTLNNCAISQMAEQNWGFHTGDHIVITGTLTAGFFNTWIATPASGDSVFNISSSLTTLGISVINGFFVPFAGGDWFDPAGLDQTDTSVTALNNMNVINSNWIGSPGFTGGTTETVLSDTSTFVKVAGTYVDSYTERFSFVGGVGTYNGIQPIYANIDVNAEVFMKSNVETDVIQMTLFKGVSEAASRRSEHSLDAVFQVPTSPEFKLQEPILLETGDTFEVRMRNTSNATNVVVTDINISVRA